MITIKKVGRYGVFENELPKKLEAAIFNRLAYQKEGWQFMSNKAWSWVRFYNKKKRCFPWGLKNAIIDILKQWQKQTGENYNIEGDGITDIGITTIDKGFYNYDDIEGLRPYQIDAINKLISNSGGILAMPTGSGKTLTTIEFLKKINFENGMIIVHTKDLKQQWDEELIDINSSTEKVVIVKTYQSLNSKNNTIDLSTYDIVIHDECLTYGMKIDTEKGKINLGKIVEKRIKTNILTYNIKNNTYELKPIIGYFKSKDKREIYNIIIKNKKTGRIKKLSCTKEHKWFTNEGYKSTINLKIGDRLYHREYVCPKCLKICKGEKSIGGHWNTVHINLNSERDKSIKEKIGKTVSRGIKEGRIPNSFLKVGNGKGMSKLEKYFYNTFLDKSWYYNYAIGSGKGGYKKYGFVNYKIDFYNEKLQVGIEVDGKGIHDSVKQKKLDVKKNKLLVKLGYKILRLDEKTLKSFNTKEDFEKWMNGKL